MHVSNIEIITGKDFCRLQATVITAALDNDPYLIWFQVPVKYKELITRSGNPFVAALLLPCMVTGEELIVDGTVSTKLFKSLSVIQDIYKSWDKNLKKVEINPSSFTNSNNSESKTKTTAAFFSGGVDSLYTLLKQEDERERNENQNQQMEYLLLVRGFDIPICKEHDATFEAVLTSCNIVAEELHKKIVPVTTNVREFIDLFVPWGLGHGACIASVGLVMDFFHAIYIASTCSYGELMIWGSHPLLDPLWSTEDINFIHDGCEASRLEKIRFIRQFPIALKTVRVCYTYPVNNKEPVYNCGRCGKCLKTMIGLHIMGALNTCEVFPAQIDLGMVRKIKVNAPVSITQELFDALEETGYEGEIKSALGDAFISSGLDPYINMKKEKPELPAYLWQQSLYRINNELAKIVGQDQKFILVDQDEMRVKLKKADQAIPFLERSGIYNGVPPDAETAIAELQRLCKDGAAYIVVASPAFWWLDYYKEWHQYLRSNFNCILENERMVIFDLRKNLPGNSPESGCHNIENIQ